MFIWESPGGPDLAKVHSDSAKRLTFTGEEMRKTRRQWQRERRQTKGL